MNRYALLASAAIAALTVNLANAANGSGTLIDANGKNVGSVELAETPSGITKLTISASGLTQGWHGLHLHEVGECNAEDGFKSAGGHLAGGKEHGIMSEGGPHPGDMPNQMVQGDGILVAEVFNPRLNMTSEGTAPVFDDDGSAIIIHAGRDDYTSQPAGAAGDRVACAVIEKKE